MVLTDNAIEISSSELLRQLDFHGITSRQQTAATTFHYVVHISAPFVMDGTISGWRTYLIKPGATGTGTGLSQAQDFSRPLHLVWPSIRAESINKPGSRSLSPRVSRLGNTQNIKAPVSHQKLKINLFNEHHRGISRTMTCTIGKGRVQIRV